jgi:hypothetical protein
MRKRKIDMTSHYTKKQIKISYKQTNKLRSTWTSCGSWITLHTEFEVINPSCTMEVPKIIRAITTTYIVSPWTPSAIALKFHQLNVDFQRKTEYEIQWESTFRRHPKISFTNISIMQGHAVTTKGNTLPFVAVKTGSKIESHREQPRITVHSNQWKPIFPVHAISCKIDPKCWLGKLRRNFLGRQSYFPCFSWMSIQTQVLLI